MTFTKEKNEEIFNIRISIERRISNKEEKRIILDKERLNKTSLIIRIEKASLTYSFWEINSMGLENRRILFVTCAILVVASVLYITANALPMWFVQFDFRLGFNKK